MRSSHLLQRSNVRSRRVMERLGMTYDSRQTTSTIPRWSRAIRSCAHVLYRIAEAPALTGVEPAAVPYPSAIFAVSTLATQCRGRIGAAGAVALGARVN